MKIPIFAIVAIAVLALAPPSWARHGGHHHASRQGRTALGSGGAFGKGASGGRSTLGGGNPGGSADRN